MWQEWRPEKHARTQHVRRPIQQSRSGAEGSRYQRFQISGALLLMNQRNTQSTCAVIMYIHLNTAPVPMPSTAPQCVSPCMIQPTSNARALPYTHRAKLAHPAGSNCSGT
jgi:hypothetical protein